MTDLSDHFKTLQSLISPALIVICIIAFLSTVFLAYRHISYKKHAVDSAKTEIIKLTKKAATDIDESLKIPMSVARSLADELSKGDMSRDQLEKLLSREMSGNPLYFGIAVAYKPYAHDPHRRLYAPYCKREGEHLKTVQIEDLYDYSEGHDWYSLGMEKGESWAEPFFGKASDTLVTTISVPFYSGNSQDSKVKGPCGVVAIVISLDSIRKKVESLELGAGGFGSLISKKGSYIYHPVSEYIKSRQSIFDIAASEGDSRRLAAAKKATEGNAGMTDLVSISTGAKSWFVFEPVRSAGWSLLTTYSIADISQDQDFMRRQIILMLPCAILFIVSLAALLLKVHVHGGMRFWALSAITALALIIAMGITWKLALTMTPTRLNANQSITDRIGLTKFKKSLETDRDRESSNLPSYIPTGLFLQSIEFAGPNKLSMSGYFWQRFSNASKISNDLIFSNAVDVKTEEITRRKDGNDEVVVWSFRGIFYEKMDYSTYPIDSILVKLNMRHRNPWSDVVPVPDLDAYKFLLPSSLPGLADNFVLPGWKVEKSFFELKKRDYGTNFGQLSGRRDEKMPEMSFAVEIKRNFLDAFIQSMTSIVVVAIMLFAVLMTKTSDEVKAKRIGMDTGKTLAFVGSMFFVTIVSHINTRGKIVAQDIFYLEYFYFVMYITLLWISATFIIFSMARNFRLFQYKDNLVSKLLYWPVLLGILFTFTAVTFY